MSVLLERPTTLPSKEDTALAQEASRVISKAQPEELRVRLGDQELMLPKAATRLIQHLLTEMSLGNAVTIIPIHAELTTQEAADFLNVSRPHVVKLLEQRKSSSTWWERIAAFALSDLVKYKRNAETERREVMQELATQAKNWGWAIKPSSYTVVLDACVLYPAPLRDLLMELAAAGLYRAKWTSRIHEEWTRNVLENRPDITKAATRKNGTFDE